MNFINKIEKLIQIQQMLMFDKHLPIQGSKVNLVQNFCTKSFTELKNCLQGEIYKSRKIIFHEPIKIKSYEMTDLFLIFETIA